MSAKLSDEELRQTLIALATHNDREIAAAIFGLKRSGLERRMQQLYKFLDASSLMDCILKAWSTGVIKPDPSARQLGPLEPGEQALLKMFAQNLTRGAMSTRVGKSQRWIMNNLSGLRTKFEINGQVATDKHVVVYAALSVMERNSSKSGR